jgi:hypothetical protein
VTPSKELIARMRKLADERAMNAGVAGEPCPPEAECDDCDTVRALRDGAEAIEKLTARERG